jgi:hypothetical protein
MELASNARSMGEAQIVPTDLIAMKKTSDRVECGVKQTALCNRY